MPSSWPNSFSFALLWIIGLFIFFITKLVQKVILLVSLLPWKKRSTQWECPPTSWLCLIWCTFNIVIIHLRVFQSRCLFCGSKYLSNATFLSFCLPGTGVLSVGWFSLCASFLSNCFVTSDTSSLPRSLCLFLNKGLSCVLFSNPFKIPCTFLNDGNPLTRQGRWESWKPHQKGLLNLLWQQGRMLGLASLRSESTFVSFLKKGRETVGACWCLVSSACQSHQHWRKNKRLRKNGGEIQMERHK